MKKKIIVQGIKCLLFPVLFLGSCSSPGNQSSEKAEKDIHKTDTVTIQLMKFNPQELTVNIGDTVVWINKGMVPHTVKSYQDNKFYSDTLDPGKTWIWIVKDSAAYYCTLHPAAMKGNLKLE